MTDEAEEKEPADALFEALWAKAEEDWDNDKPHQALLQHALDKQMLPELAGRYRKVQDDPAKGVKAKKKIDGIVVAATQMLMATKSPPRTKTPWSWTVTAIMLFGITIAFIFYKLILGR